MKTRNDSSSEPFDRSSGMDVLSDVLSTVRFTGSMLFVVNASYPWLSWAPEAEVFRPFVLPTSQHLISYHIVTRGVCWAGLRDQDPVSLQAGDVLVIPHGDAYFMANPPDAKPTYGVDEAVDFFSQMAAGEIPTSINEGGGGADSTQFICGFLGVCRQPFNPLLIALPRMIQVSTDNPTGGRMHHLIEFALAEMAERSSGSSVVLTRVAELLFVEILRRYLLTTLKPQAGWLAALQDPLIARVLKSLHSQPARRWTLDTLASVNGTSRLVLVERFSEQVGQPPMHYLTQWRMQLASRLLMEPGPNKVFSVAEAVGYASESAFSRAFKKSVGVAPAIWRQQSQNAV